MISTTETDTLSDKDLKLLNSVAGITDLMRFQKIDYRKTLKFLEARNELKKLQVDLLKMEKWISRKKYRLAIIFEGRDLAGKGGLYTMVSGTFKSTFLSSRGIIKTNRSGTGTMVFSKVYKSSSRSW